jgi:hypothetical protein
MNLKKIASVLALTSLFATGAAMADDQTVTFENGSTVASFKSVGTVLAGYDDVLTFTGLAAGTYDFVLTISGQNIQLYNGDGFVGITLNGVVGSVDANGKVLFANVEGTGDTPFVLTLSGSTLFGGTAVYSGELSVTAVPEPETYALMLAGLGAVALVARRRKSA